MPRFGFAAPPAGVAEAAEAAEAAFVVPPAFVAGAGFDEEAGGKGMRVGIDLGDDVETVWEAAVLELQGHGWSLRRQRA